MTKARKGTVAEMIASIPEKELTAGTAYAYADAMLAARLERVRKPES